jgi:ectoine hydroxylase-related dioxygenase (phytanoyl-CoA dioxygenase family)
MNSSLAPIKNNTFNKEKFIAEFEKEGSVIIENILDSDFISKVAKEVEEGLQKEVDYHGHTNFPTYGYILSNAKYGGAFLELFDNKKLMEPINTIMGEGSIAYSYTSSSLPPLKGNESSKVHTDSPVFIPNYILRMGVIVALVDFTIENGATHYLPKSQAQEQKPDDKYFYENAKRLTIKAGSAWFFNTRLWHAGGINNTSNWRHALTLNICRPWMKQRIDIPALMKDMDLSNVSPIALQKLGFFSQIPTSYNEYWAPEKERKFTQSNV